VYPADHPTLVAAVVRRRAASLTAKRGLEGSFSRAILWLRRRRVPDQHRDVPSIAVVNKRAASGAGRLTIRGLGLVRMWKSWCALWRGRLARRNRPQDRPIRLRRCGLGLPCARTPSSVTQHRSKTAWNKNITRLVIFASRTDNPMS
jgi:hypothetical protein